MIEKLYVGDTGTVIALDCGQDVSAATARTIEAQKPNGTTVTWAAVASGTNAISFTTLADSLDVPGKWKLQAKITLPGGGPYRGRTAAMTVYPFFG
jgi:hypothetical protein